MRQSVLKFLEEQLLNYEEYKERIEILHKRKQQDRFLIKPLERHLNLLTLFYLAIDEALFELGGLHKTFFELYFVKHKNIEKIAIEMRLTQYTVEKLKREVIEKVAEKFGIVP